MHVCLTVHVLNTAGEALAEIHENLDIKLVEFLKALTSPACERISECFVISV